MFLKQDRPTIRFDEDALFALPESGDSLDPEEVKRQELFIKIAGAKNIAEMEEIPFEELLDMYFHAERLCGDIFNKESSHYEKLFDSNSGAKFLQRRRLL